MESKVVLITGCSSGIGLCTAVILAKYPDKKYIVYATMRNLKKKGDLEKAAGSTLNETLFIKELDVTKEETIARVVGEVKETHGRVDVLFNNAGWGNFMIIEQTSIQEMRDMMDTNFFGAVRMIQAVLPLMKQRHSGRILNNSSIFGLYGSPFSEAYTASKFALEGMTDALAIQLRQHGIWVISIQPGPIDTPIKENFIVHTEMLEDERVDTKTKASFQSLLAHMDQVARREIKTPEQLFDAAIRPAIEDEKPHLRYRYSGVFPFENLRYTDKHSDDYIDMASKALFQSA